MGSAPSSLDHIEHRDLNRGGTGVRYFDSFRALVPI